MRAIVSAVTLGILLASCYGHPDERLPALPEEFTDRSFLAGEPCAPPCWQGLQVCVATRDDVTRTTSLLSFLDLSGAKTGDSYRRNLCTDSGDVVHLAEIQVPCARPADRTCAWLDFQDDVLVGVHLLLNYELSIQDVQLAFGDPDYVMISPWGPECLACKLTMLYPSRGLAVSHDTSVCSAWSQQCKPVLDGLPVDPALRITFVEFWPQTFFDQVRESGEALPWPGLGE